MADKGDSVRENLLGLGIIILFVGVVVFSFSNRVVREEQYVPVNTVRNLPYGEWKVTAYFEEGETIFVGFRGPNLEGVPNGERWAAEMWANITDPNGGNTTILMRFRLRGQTPELNVTVQAKSDGLTVDEPAGDFNDSPLNIGGVTVYSGNYTVYMYTYGVAMAEYYYSPSGDLPRLEFLKVVMNIEYPQRGFLPLGAGCIIVGVSLFLLAMRSSKRSKLQRRKAGK